MTKHDRNRTEYAILGLLALGPRSGYDIKKEAEEVLGHFWHESYGHIYPTLGRLHGDGLVEKRVEVQEGRPNRNVYSITTDGEAELNEWLTEPVERRPPRNELLLKVFFGRFSGPEAVRSILEDYRDQQAEALARLETAVEMLDAGERGNPSYAYWRMTAELGLRAMAVVVQWCEDTARLLEEMEEEE
ncbi:MAG: PadR family transcriptional regulator [Gemmatimonadota bacterium]|nr:PadR family transcriptional regulator [Gemmatimonadota bacterium]